MCVKMRFAQECGLFAGHSTGDCRLVETAVDGEPPGVCSAGGCVLLHGLRPQVRPKYPAVRKSRLVSSQILCCTDMRARYVAAGWCNARRSHFWFGCHTRFVRRRHFVNAESPIFGCHVISRHRLVKKVCVLSGFLRMMVLSVLDY